MMKFWMSLCSLLSRWVEKYVGCACASEMIQIVVMRSWSTGLTVCRKTWTASVGDAVSKLPGPTWLLRGKVWIKNGPHGIEWLSYLCWCSDYITHDNWTYRRLCDIVSRTVSIGYAQGNMTISFMQGIRKMLGIFLINHRFFKREEWLLIGFLVHCAWRESQINFLAIVRQSEHP